HSQIVNQSSRSPSTMNAWLNTQTPGGVFVGKNAGGQTWTQGHSAFYLGNVAATRATPGTLPTAVRNSGGFIQGDQNVADNSWHMLTYVDTGAGKQIYVDGQPLTLNEAAFNGTDTSSVVRLGFSVDSLPQIDGTANYAGIMDELKFYNLALSQTQIQQL